MKHFEGFGVFAADNSTVFRKQSGTFRTNCIDCLDRTNAVQTMIGLEVSSVLQLLSNSVESHEILPFMRDFK